jgi:ubiquitin C-terminal hydrolase
MFEGRLQCPVCGCVSLNYEPFLHLQVEIKEVCYVENRPCAASVFISAY